MGFFSRNWQGESEEKSTSEEERGERGGINRRPKRGRKGGRMNTRCGVKEKKREGRGQERTHK